MRNTLIISVYGMKLWYDTTVMFSTNLGYGFNLHDISLKCVTIHSSAF